jgi:4-amino-4-deoxy-L-arabinose transferase-like glycosyltransferase
MYASFAAAALAVLSKGLEAVVLPGAVLVLYMLVRRDWCLWRRLHLAGGLAIFLVIAAPWFFWVAQANPKFLWFFFIHEHIERYLTPVAQRKGPWWLFLPIFVFGLAPWFPQLVRALGSGAKNLFTKQTRFDVETCLWLWVAVIITFFSFSDSKLESYILPVMPAAALLVGRQVAALRVADLTWSGFILGAAGVVGLWLAPTLGAHHHNWPAALYADLIPWLFAAFGLWLAAAALALVLARRSARWAAGVTACGMLLGWQVLITGSEALSPIYSTHALARRIDGANRPGLPFYTVESYEQALPFYLRRTVTPVAYQGELAFGMAQAPHQWIPTIAAFRRRWRQDSAALAMLPKRLYPRFRASGLSMRVVAEDPRYVVVEKP